MDRPKHRRIFLMALVLLAGGASLLLLGRQWASPPRQVIVPAELPAKQVADPQAESDEAAAIESASPSAPASAATASRAPAAGFRGRVVDAVTRQPVKEFDVEMIPVQRDYVFSDEGLVSRHFTSGTGRFSWTDLAAGTWRGAIKAPGYQQFNVDKLQIATDKASREIVMPLLRGYAVRGRVFERRTGAGVADAWVSFRPVDVDDDYRRRRSRTQSQADGSFTLDGTAGGDVELTVFAENHAPRVVQVFVDEKTPPQEIAVSSGGTLGGTVTTAAGVPVKGSLSIMGPGMNLGTETNDAGVFTFPHMREGRYQISVSTNAGSTTQDVALGEDEIKEGILLVVEAGRSIRGALKGVSQDQLQRVHIGVRSDSKPQYISASIDAQGRYSLAGVAPGHAVISVFGAGLQFDKPVDVPVDQDITVDIVFPAGARVSGRVTQAGKPLVHKMVWMRPVENKNGTLYRAATSEDGEYEIQGLPPTDYFMRADEDISRRIAIAGDTVINIEIPSVQLSARVLEDGGSVPIVGANVYLRGSAPETARVRGDKQTDDFGQFSMTGIDQGEVVLMVYKPGYEMYREKISYSAPITNKTITLRKNDGVEVRVPSDSRRFPIGFTITQSFPGNDYTVDIWIPLDHERVGHIPSALAGTTFQIGRFSGQPLVFEDWDGQPFELP
jgi:hypothetical protein